jgi:Sec-independent protein secretion pathway component TatC
MKINTYLKELQYTIIYSLISILFSSLISYQNKEKLIVLISDNLLQLKYTFIYTNFTEAILSYITISLIFGIYISLPILV